jgi:hypothetical protein
MTVPADPVDAVTEADARGATAAIFADIRATLAVEVVNLVWRHLATMPGALEWVWSTLKPLYLGAARDAADDVRRNLDLPAVPPLSADTLHAAGLDDSAQAGIRAILASYHHTNALALVAFSAFLARTGHGAGAPPPRIAAPAGIAHVSRAALPRLTPLAELAPPVARLVDELNRFGEDTDTALVASMYRHLSHWPGYLALVRTLLIPLLPMIAPPPAPAVGQASAAVRRFVDHPIARMTAICALMRRATPGED